jgi:aspartate carbamoyltransferase regulatory subunit
MLIVGSVGVLVGLLALDKVAEKEKVKLPETKEEEDFPKRIEPKEIEPATVKEKEIIREKEFVKEVVVKVRCPYCQNLYDETLDRCPHCGGAR